MLVLSLASSGMIVIGVVLIQKTESTTRAACPNNFFSVWRSKHRISPDIAGTHCDLHQGGHMNKYPAAVFAASCY